MIPIDLDVKKIQQQIKEKMQFADRPVENKNEPDQKKIKSTRIYIYKSKTPEILQHLGKIYQVAFSYSDKDLDLISAGFKLSIFNNTNVFCRVLPIKEKEVKSLNLNWKEATIYSFSIRHKIDYEKLLKWYNQVKKSGAIISSFFMR